jgi:hypothetical protein
MKAMWWIVGGVLALGAAAWGPLASHVEQPKFDLVEADGDVEIRDYAPMIVAETEVSGDRDEAIGKGFRTIAGYIFGDNRAKQKVAMTAPVTQRSGEKISMTAPVTQQGGGDSWQVRFVMPSTYTLDSLPEPTNEAVKLVQVPAKRYAAIRFSGVAGEGSLKRHAAELSAFLTARNLKPLSAPTYAFYNPPWTLPFFRRNEVLIEIPR